MATEPAPTTSSSLIDRIRPRAERRGEPRVGVVIAAAGCALAVFGALVVSGDQLSGDAFDGGSTNRGPGIALCLAFVVAGYAAVRLSPRTPLATAGVVASVLALPPLLFFLTFDAHDAPPYSTELILGASAVAWLVSYAVGATRGHVLYLAAGLVFLWAFALQVIEQPFSAPFGIFNVFGAQATSTFSETGTVIGPDPSSGGFSTGTSLFDPPTPLVRTGGFGNGLDIPDPTTIGLISIAFGVGYLVVRRRLDKRGLHGAALGFVVPGLLALFSGIAFLGDDLEVSGTGLAYFWVGVLIAADGAMSGRRGTTWFGGALVALGTGLFVGDLLPDDASPNTGGVAFMLAGGALVLLAVWLAATTHEPPDDEPGPSVLRRPTRPAGSAPVAAPPPGAAPAEPSPWAPPPPPVDAPTTAPPRRRAPLRADPDE